MKFAVGQAVSNYRIVDILGEGGMGAVYRASHQETGQQVALKVMFDEASAHRFRLESHALGALKHPGVPVVYEIGEEPVFYYAQEIIEGPSLEARLAEPITQTEAIELFLSLLDVLEAVHSSGGVHRDVTPNNILLRGGRACLIDFGLIRMVGGADQGVTVSGEILGTPEYMAPEQIDRHVGEISPATDLFAAATILYRMLVGRLPTEPGSLPRVMRQVVSKPPLPPEGLPDALARVVLKGLEKKPAERFHTAREFAQALQAIN